jgi:hypothetical protein
MGGGHADPVEDQQQLRPRARMGAFDEVGPSGARGWQPIVDCFMLRSEVHCGLGLWLSVGTGSGVGGSPCMVGPADSMLGCGGGGQTIASVRLSSYNNG